MCEPRTPLGVPCGDRFAITSADRPNVAAKVRDRVQRGICVRVLRLERTEQLGSMALLKECREYKRHLCYKHRTPNGVCLLRSRYAPVRTSSCNGFILHWTVTRSPF